MRPAVDLAPGERAWLSERALLVGAEDPAALAAGIKPLDEGLSLVVGLRSVLVEADGPLDEDRATELLGRASTVGPRAEAAHHVIDVTLDGEDLDEALERCELDLDEVGRALSATPLTVAAVGFAPGFGYLEGLRGPLTELERRARPRPRVPACSLAVAAGYAALYPQASPGGWWLLGRTSSVLFDQRRRRPSLLAAGDSVQLRIAEQLAPAPRAADRDPLAPPPGVPAAVRVLAAPAGCSIVDDGRRGHVGVGVPRGGALDPDRAVLLRRLLAGAPGLLEVAAGGLELEALSGVVIAAVGLELAVDGRVVPSGLPIALGPGARLRVERVEAPIGYLGLLGGPLVSDVLGSMGTDSLSHTGPGWLRAGDVLGAEPSGGRPRGSLSLGPAAPSRLRLLAGPHRACLADEALLVERELRVVEPSNRVGLRLEPVDGPLERRAVSLTSFPVVTGAVQATPDGSLVVLGPDHATLGGYPVVGCVIGADHGRLGRLAPGDLLSFELVDLDGARAAAEEQARALKRSLGATVPRLADDA
jgi:allophanate hydrolase subunit 2/allophanate hydrolase subunit 1